MAVNPLRGCSSRRAPCAPSGDWPLPRLVEDVSVLLRKTCSLQGADDEPGNTDTPGGPGRAYHVRASNELRHLRRSVIGILIIFANVLAHRVRHRSLFRAAVADHEGDDGLIGLRAL